MTQAANNPQAQASTEAKVAAMLNIPEVVLDEKHGDLFGQMVFGHLKRNLTGEFGAHLKKAYDERTVLDKVTYHTDGAYQSTKEAATEAYGTVKEIVVDSYETAKGWFTGANKENAKRKAEDAAEAAANNQAQANRDRFNKHFDQIEKTVDYKKDWENKTGYFDHLVNDKDLQVALSIGEVAKSVDPDGRRMIIMQTPLGLLVVFARHNDEKTSYRVNADKDLIKEIEGFKDECTNSVLTAKGFDIIFGEADTETLAAKLMKS